jgi:hypothetical protein
VLDWRSDPRISALSDMSSRGPGLVRAEQCGEDAFGKKVLKAGGGEWRRLHRIFFKAGHKALSFWFEPGLILPVLGRSLVPNVCLWASGSLWFIFG